MVCSAPYPNPKQMQEKAVALLGVQSRVQTRVRLCSRLLFT